MKSIYQTFRKAALLCFVFLQVSLFSQTAQIGSGVSVSSTTGPSPINNYYRSQHVQIVYSKGELNAAGITGGNIEELGFYVVSSTSQAMPDYTIRLGHTTERDASPYLNTPMNQVYFRESYAPTAGGYDMLDLDTAWYWNGVDNLVVDICFDYGVQPSIQTGTVRTYNDSNYRISYAVSSTLDLCGTSNPSSTTVKPQIQLKFTAAAANDAGVAGISPQANVCGGSQSVTATIINYGTNTLTSASVNWSVNGVVQTPTNFAGSLSTQGGVSAVALGNYSFTEGVLYNIIAWTSSPNGNVDANPNNDSLSVAVKGALGGTYTIGGGGADYVSFTNAVSDLETYGVCGDVTFNVASGGYFEQLEINEIPGVGSNAIVTFQSTSGDSSTVVLSHSASNSNNYTLYINGGNWISFRNITIESTNNTYDRVVQIGDESHHLSFENNSIRNAAAITPYGYRNIEIISNANSDWLNFSNNRIENGYRGIYNASQNSDHYTIANNLFANQQYGGVELYYADFVEVDDNTIITTGSSGIDGIFIYDADSSVSVQRNIVKGAVSGQGIELQYCDGSSGNPLIVANNFVRIGENAGTSYGIYIFVSRFVDVVYNTVNVGFSSINHRGLFINSGNDNNVLNNNVSTPGGYAYYVSSSGNVDLSNNNNWYTGTTNLAYWSGSIVNDLPALQTASSKDANSFNEPTYFVSDTSYQSTQVSLNNNGTSVAGISTDIEGETRSGTNPDIGCDEFTPVAIDAGVLAVTPPSVPFAPGSLPVKATIKNFGGNTLTSAVVNWSVNGILQTPVNFAGSLASGDTSSIVLGNVNFVLGTLYSVEAYTSSPNGGSDPAAVNDTASAGPNTPGLGGTFTIGGATPDFANFNEAVSILNLGGVYAPVTFNVRSGTYTERIAISSFPRLNTSDQVTFQSEILDSSAVTLRAGYLNNNTNYVIALNGVINVVFNKLKVQNTSVNSYSSVVRIDSGSSHIGFINCSLIAGPTTSSATSVVYAYKSQSGFAPQSHLTFSGCSITNGYYGIYMNPRDTRGNANTIENCTIEGFYNFGIYAYQEDSILCTGNTIIPRVSASTSSYGAYIYDAHEGEFTGNRIYGAQLRYGALIDYTDGTASYPFIVANNFIQVGGAVAGGRGLSVTGATFTEIVHNSVWTDNSNNTSTAYMDFNTAGSVSVLNNIFQNTGSGLAIDKNYTYGSQRIDYNNLYATGPNLASYGNTLVANLAAWQTISAHDSNSVSVDGQFVGITDLHTNASALNAVATPSSYVSTDIDGDLRDPSTPDIGADEFTVTGSDAGLLSFDGPRKPFSAGSQSVHVTVFNNGGDTLNSATIDWEVNGVAQTPFSWTGSLFSSQSDDSVSIGSFNFVQDTNYSIRVWISLPNGNADILAANDTVQKNNLFAGLAGVYTLGGTTPDFLDFSEASTALRQRGIVDNVIFNVRDGVYNEDVLIQNFEGTATGDSVVFQSENGDSAAVVLRTGNTSRPTLELRGVNRVSFKDMSIAHTYYWSGPGVVRIDSGGSFLNFVGCIIKDSLYQPSPSVGDYLLRTYSGHSYHNLRVVNTTFKNGRYGMYLQSGSTVNRSTNLKIQNSVFNNPYIEGIYAIYQDGAIVSGNQMWSDRGNPSYSGIEFTQCVGQIEVTKNQLRNVTGNGIYFYSVVGTSGNEVLLANNFVHLQGNSSNQVGIYLYLSNYVNVAYNSVNSHGTNISSRTYFHYGGNNCNVQNNIFQNLGGGLAIEVLTVSSFVSDYNNLFATGTNLGEYQNTAYTSLANWQAGSGLDANSVSVNAQFSDTTDFHVESATLDGAGTPLAYVSTDLDGDPRDPATPDIGADEINLNTNDASLTVFAGPQKVFPSGTQTVYVDLLNNGSDTLNSVQINWTVNGVLQTPLAWTGSLATGGSSDSVAVGTYNFVALLNHDVEVYTSLPNGQPDDLTVNDTVKQNNLFPGLSGVYTLGGISPDFADFGSAVQALHDGGVTGPVTINVRDGVYTEQLLINSIDGANSTDSVVFQSENADASLVSLEFNGNNSARYTVRLNGAGFVGFKNIGIHCLNTSYGYGVELIGGAMELRFQNCMFNNPQSSSVYGIYSPNNNLSGVRIQSCEFNNGHGGIYIQGNYGTGLRVTNNIFNHQRTYGILAYYFNEALITENVAVGAPSYAGYSGLYLAYFRDGYEITKNKCHAPYGGHGIYLYDVDGTSSARGLVANNFAIVGDSAVNASSHDAFWFQYGDYADIFYNSAHHASTVGQAGFIGNVSNADVRNNIFAASNGGYAFNTNTSPASFTTQDYNAYYTSGANLFYNSFSGIGAIATLASWQSTTGLDANSLVADPLFNSSVDLHVNQSALDSAATPVAAVTDDIDGELRHLVTPDIGADEISFLSGDISVTAISGISSGCGLSDSIQLTINLSNNGTDPQTGFDVSLLVNGDTTTETVGINLASGANANFTFAKYYDFSSIGAYSIKSWSSLVGDVNAVNDTSNLSVNNFAPPVVTLTEDTTVCGGTSVQLTASGGTNFFWSTGTTGPSITVAPNVTTTYTVTVSDANGCSALDSVMVNISSQVDSVFVTGTTCDSTVADTVMNVYVNQGGCDSVVYSVLTYSPSFVVNLPDTTICEGETVNIFGNVVGLAGTYFDTLSTGGGCDSILAQTLLVNPVDTLTLPVKTICQGDSALVFGSYQFNAGVYVNSLMAQSGCDSIITCQLIVNPVFNIGVGAQICEGQSIMLGGSLQFSSGVYYDTLSTVSGCDSVVATNLSVLPLDSTSQSLVLLVGDSVLAGGSYQKTSGLYHDTYTGSNGCDSIHAIDVNFVAPARSIGYSGRTGFTSNIVNPQVGDSYTNFEFEAVFTDANGILPPFGFPRVILDFEGNGIFNNPNDRTIIMTEVDVNDTDPTDGKLYTASINSLPVGMNWETRILVVEGGNTTVLGPVSAPNVLAQPDLEIFANDIVFSNPNPPVASPLTVSATVHNTSDYDAQNFVVHLVNQFDTNVVYPDIIVSNLPARSNTTVSWNITTPAVDAWCPMQVTVDYTDVIVESNELDNTALRPFTNGDFNIPGAIIVQTNASPSVLCASPGAQVTISGFAYYTGTAVPLSDSSVAGAAVSLTTGGASYVGVTNSLGNFSISVPAPLAPNTYAVVGQVTDFTLTGTLGTSYQIKNCACPLPDLSTSMTVSASTIVAGQSVTGTITVKNNGTAAAPASLTTISQTGGTPVLVNQAVPALAPAASHVYAFPSITFNTPGTYSICATADGDYMIAECSESNSRCITIRVLPALPDIIPINGPTSSSYLCNVGNPYFTVKNAGGVPTGLFECEVEVEQNGTPIGTFYHTITNINALQSVGFSIPFNYPSVGTYTFTIRCDTNVATGGIVTELSELNNVGVYTRSINACLPDLNVINCRTLRVEGVDPTFPGSVSYELSIRNSGNADAIGPIPVRFEVTPGNIINTTYPGNIVPGQTVVVSAISPTVAPATATLTGIADPLNVITEFSETNNSIEDNLCWEFQPVPECGSNFWNRSYLVNQTAFLSVGVDVDHLYEASSVDVQFEVSGPGIVGTQNLGNATLLNVFKNCYCPRSATLPNNFVFNQVGTYTFTMTVDPNNVYTECDETNNVLVRTVTVGSAPDMRILSQFINPSLLNPEVNDTVGITVTYENIGFGNINDQMELKLLVNNVPIDSISPVSGLVTGDNASFNFPMVWGSNIPGAHIIRAIIDSDDDISETDELNNEATRAIVVGDAANLYFQNLITSNAAPAILDTIILFAEIGNNGDVDAIADVKFSYIDNMGDTIFIALVPVNVLSHDSTSIQLPWEVLDDNTTIVAEIVNTNTLEFLYTDNMATTPIGGFTIAIATVPSCYGNTNGMLTATANGGVPPYTYAWSTGQSGNVLNGGVGTYTVQVTDVNNTTVQASESIPAAVGTLIQLPNTVVCNGDSALIFGEYRKVAGTYRDTILGVGGCDTVYVSVLRYKPTHQKSLPVLNVCAGDSALIFGNYRTMSGIYIDSLTNTSGCDSVILQQLIVNPVDTTSLFATTNDPSQSGTFIAQLSSSKGCDSTVVTIITYVPSGCVNDSLSVHEVSCDSSLAGTSIVSYPKSDGCDSVVTTITIYDPGSTTALNDKLICDGDSILVFGLYESMAGTYYDTLLNKNGCDSILSCTVDVSPVYTTSSALSICEGDSIAIFGKYESMSGVYSDTLQSKAGCDSIHTVSLTVKPTIMVSILDSICPGDGRFVGGGYQTTAGVYQDTLVAANSCDSIVTTTLTMRTDPGCGSTASGDSLVIVTDAGWMKSTEINIAEAGGYPWQGISSLPGVSTYTLPAEIGQPYPWHSIDSVEGAHVFRSDNGVAFYRTTFSLTVDTGVQAQIRTRMDDGMEIYINGYMIAREDDRDVINWQGVQHHILLKADGSQVNGYNGDQAFDVLNNYRLDSVVQTGMNELIIAHRNAPQLFDKGGFSFRMDMQTGKSAPQLLSQYIVSDGEWMKSTVVTKTGTTWNWPGVSSLPPSSSYTEPVDLGQPYHYYSTEEIEGSFAIKGTEKETYYRRRFSIIDSADINVRLRSTFDENMMVFINDSLIVGHYYHGLLNRSLLPHDVAFSVGNLPVNGNAGGDMYSEVEDVDFNQILRKGDNYITVVLQNRAGDKGGFSLRLDLDKAGSSVIRKDQFIGESDGNSRSASPLAFELYPNPASSSLNILKEDASQINTYQISIADINGKLLHKQSVSGKQMQEIVILEVGDLADGVYFVKVYSGERSFVKRFIKM